MLDAANRHIDQLPNRPGVGYKPQHYSDILANPAPVDWLEVHAENYMGDGGRPLAQLRHLPEEGETFEDQDWIFEIVDMDGRKIDKLIVRATDPEID